LIFAARSRPSRIGKTTCERDSCSGTLVVLACHSPPAIMNENVRILVVEDDEKIASFTVKGLKQAGYAVDRCADGERALALALTVTYDAAVVDLMLPKLDGLSLIRQLRAKKVRLPVVILSARASVDDRVRGLQAGGDDYLTKPFAFAELLARLEALIRRSGAERSAEVAGLVLDPAKHAVTCGGESVRLTPTEFRLLAKLAAYPGEAVRRKVLVETGWPHGAIVHDNTLDAYMVRLRRKVCDLPGAPQITTVRGVGYSLQ
jgi:two-component system OmpR family response regulator